MVPHLRIYAAAAALGLAGLATSGVALADSGCAAVCDSAKQVVNVANTNDLANSVSCSATTVKVVACGDAAASVMNVANVASSATCDAAKSSCASGAQVVNVANKEAKSGCAAVCASGEELIASAASAEKTDGLGGGDAGDTEGAHAHYDLGHKVSDFTLPHAQSGQERSLSSLAGDKATVLIFWNQSCPWVESETANAAADKVISFANTHKDHGVNVVLIDAGIENSAEVIIEYAKNREGFDNLPLLLNRDSSLAARFNASYTPEAFILDSDMTLVYKGAFQARQGESWTYPAEAAVRNLIHGEPVAVTTASGRGCTIKWAPGSRPAR